MNRSLLHASLLLCAWNVLGGQACVAQFDYEAEPVRYSKTAPTDAVAQLRSAIDDGVVSLEWDRRQGWLPALLDYLSVPADSQTLVFSKTSMQRRMISPARPRALYFSDDVYVGWIPDAPLLEVSAVDPTLGAVFYTVDQADRSRPVIKRDSGQCLACHATRQTEGVPGYLLRSVFPADTGEPRLDFGSEVTTPATPHARRYGGWYVTSVLDPLKHRGNLMVVDDELTPMLSQRTDSLQGVVNTRAYPAPGSDIVALLVMEHQAHVHNLIARASHETRQALHYDAALNAALQRPEGHVSDSARRRIAAAADRLVRGLLMVDEPALPAAVRGAGGFAERFAQGGPCDDSGRSLRQLDLKRRLFRYPCSHLIYSDAFDALPPAAAAEVQARLSAALADDPAAGFEGIPLGDRRAVRQILNATKPGLLTERR